jgi:hypothetical protein
VRVRIQLFEDDDDREVFSWEIPQPEMGLRNGDAGRVAQKWIEPTPGLGITFNQPNGQVVVSGFELIIDLYRGYPTGPPAGNFMPEPAGGPTPGDK